jgi:hypothetical protein
MRDFCDTRLSVTLAYHKRYILPLVIIIITWLNSFKYYKS